MSLTTDREDPELHEVKPNGENKKYLVLSDAERSLGWVRPFRDTYVHVGKPVLGEIVELEGEEKERMKGTEFVAFIKYPESELPLTGRYINQQQLSNIRRSGGKHDGCGQMTSMARPIAETYARNPKFYGATFCNFCKTHMPVDEFVWEGTDLKVGS